LQGEVLAVEGNTFTVHAAGSRHRRFGRQLSVLTNDTTAFRAPGVSAPSIADLQVGDRIAGEGTIEEDGTRRAALVVVLPEQVARLTGEVVAIEEAALELDTPGGTVNVLTDADTILRIPGVEEPTVDDVGIGDQVIAAGTWEDETTFNAISIGVRGGRRARQQRGVVRGRVILVKVKVKSEVETDQIVLGTLRGPVTVLVDDETQYRVPDVDAPSLDDVTIGAVVGARGTWNEDGTLQATSVAVLGGG
jgi:hypothetical protein